MLGALEAPDVEPDELSEKMVAKVGFKTSEANGLSENDRMWVGFGQSIQGNFSPEEYDLFTQILTSLQEDKDMLHLVHKSISNYKSAISNEEEVQVIE